jgi:hypothetical protein
VLSLGVRIANDRDPRRHSGPGEEHAMPRLCWRVCDVALVGNKHRHRSNSEFHPAFQNEPELRASYVKVTQILELRRVHRDQRLLLRLLNRAIHPQCAPKRRRNSNAHGKGCLTFSTNSLSVIGYGPPNKDTRLAALPPQIVAKNPGERVSQNAYYEGKEWNLPRVQKIREFRRWWALNNIRQRSTSQCSTISSPPRVAQQYRTLNNIRAKRSTISNALKTATAHSTIFSRSTISAPKKPLNNIRAKRSTISNALNSYATQQYLAAQQYPPPNRSTISGQKSAQHNIQLEGTQQYPTTLNSTALNNI